MTCHCKQESCAPHRLAWKEWSWLFVGILLLLAAVLLPLPWVAAFSLFVAAYLCCGVDVLLASFHNLLRGEVFDENFLMTVATLGAFAIGEYPEAVSVMLFYQIGEKLQDYASGTSRRKITALMDLRPAFARVLENDQEQEVDPTQVQVGQCIRVRGGERIPLDAQVVRGQSQLDASSLTGESRPIEVRVGQEVLAGCINMTGILDLRVTKTYAHSAVAQILELAEHAATQKSKTEKFITRFARIYTPCVVFLALLVAILPPLCGWGTWHDWIYKALIFLVISCPCALVLSVPLGFFGGIGGAAHHGILLKGGTYLELLTRVGTMCFDKTGTLTQGVFQVLQITPQAGTSMPQLLALAAAAQAHSNHPVAKAIMKKFAQVPATVTTVQEIAGEGMKATYNGQELLVGNRHLLEQAHIEMTVWPEGTCVLVAYGGKYRGSIELGDVLKPTTLRATELLQKGRVKQLVLVSGDNASAVCKTAQEINIKQYFGGLLPAGKMQVLEDFITHDKPHCATVFVGDGINDAPVLKRADVGIAMGAAGTDAAMEAADVVLMGDDPMQVVHAIDIARFTMRIIKQNIWLALLIKLIVLMLAVAGLANLWMAVFADVGVSLLAVANSLRTLYYKIS